MKSENEIKQELRTWILKVGKVTPEGLTNETPLIEKRIIKSLQIMELILLIEKLKGSRFDLKAIKPGAFNTIDSIYRSFFV
jgi:acyl carrier protein